MALPGNCPPGCASRPYAAHFAAFSAALRVVWGRSLVDQGAAPARRSDLVHHGHALCGLTLPRTELASGPHGAHPSPRAAWSCDRPLAGGLELASVREHVLGRAGRATGWPRTPAQDAVLGWAGGVPGGAHRLRPPRGVPLSRERLLMWILLGLLAFSLTNVRAWSRGVVLEWLPFALVLWAYDFLRGQAARSSSRPTCSRSFAPTRFSSEGRLRRSGCRSASARLVDLHWYDYVTWVVYVSYFLATYLVAAFLWFFARGLFRRFVAMVSLLALMGFATYALFPAAPPGWRASSDSSSRRPGRSAPSGTASRSRTSIPSSIRALSTQIRSRPSLPCTRPTPC